MKTRTAADGTILSYEVDICIPGKGSYRSTRHLRLMRKYNVPLMAENEDNEVADSSIPDSADFRMNGSVPTSPSKTADRRITRSYKNKQHQLMAARQVGILPESEPKAQNEVHGDTEVAVSAERSSHGGVRSWSYVTDSRYKGLRVGGSLPRLGSMALDTSKKTCRYLHIGYSIVTTLVIFIQAICQGFLFRFLIGGEWSLPLRGGPNPKVGE